MNDFIGMWDIMLHRLWNQASDMIQYLNTDYFKILGEEYTLNIIKYLYSYI